MQLSLGFHGVTVDSVLYLDGGVLVKVPKASADEGRPTVLPEQPVENLHAVSWVLRQEHRVLLRQILKDTASFEHVQRWAKLAVHECGNLRVWVDLYEPTAELVQRRRHDVDLPGIVLNALQTIQLLQKNGYLLPIRSTQRVKLQRVLPNLKLLLGTRASCRPIHRAKLPSLFLRFPDLRDLISLWISDSLLLCSRHGGR
mmetsp:Transcript_6064/g.10952  ORF Transcript_6064/g.10952 Transcript_6064/m.10952 type:complete len:200 (+) Transcript_6064:447-1046(+)